MLLPTAQFLSCNTHS